MASRSWGRDRRSSRLSLPGQPRRGEVPHPGFVLGAHPSERHSWARCPAPWRRLAAGPAAPGRWAAPASRARPVGTEPGGRGRGRPEPPWGSRAQMGRGPRAAADGCEAGLGPSDKGYGQMFEARCSRDGGRLGKISLLPRRPTPEAVWGGPRTRCGGCVRRQGQRGSGEQRQGLRESLAEEF